MLTLLGSHYSNRSGNLSRTGLYFCSIVGIKIVFSPVPPSVYIVSSLKLQSLYNSPGCGGKLNTRLCKAYSFLFISHFQGAFLHKPLTLKEMKKQKEKESYGKKATGLNGNWSWFLKTMLMMGQSGVKEKVNKYAYRINTDIL